MPVDTEWLFESFAFETLSLCCTASVFALELFSLKGDTDIEDVESNEMFSITFDGVVSVNSDVSFVCEAAAVIVLLAISRTASPSGKIVSANHKFAS